MDGEELKYSTNSNDPVVEELRIALERVNAARIHVATCEVCRGNPGRPCARGAAFNAMADRLCTDLIPDAPLLRAGAEKHRIVAL